MYRSLLNSVGEGEGMIWENGIEACIISYKKQIASPGSIQDTGCLAGNFLVLSGRRQQQEANPPVCWVAKAALRG